MPDLNFESIVMRTVSLQGRPFESRACPDQCLGRIGDAIDRTAFPMRGPIADRSDRAALVMVLESPHREEFSGEPGPAKGPTGQMIRSHIQESLNFEGLQDMDLLLINAIQFQCSLGSPTKVYRDRIFRAVWSDGGMADFIGRVASASKPGDVIVNCCTRGNDFEIYEPLRSLVEAALRRTLPQFLPMRRMHPASWCDKEKITKEWRY